MISHDFPRQEPQVRDEDDLSEHMKGARRWNVMVHVGGGDGKRWYCDDQLL